MPLPLPSSLPLLAQASGQALPARTWAAVGFGLVVGLAVGMRLMPAPEVFDGHRQLQLVLLLLLALGAAAGGWGAASWQALPRAARSGLIAVLGLGIASALAAARPLDALAEVAHLALTFVAMAVVADGIGRVPAPARKAALLVPVALAAALGVLMAGVAYGMHVFGAGTPLFPRAGHLFSHPRHFNQIQTWTLPLLPLLVVQARSHPARVAAFALLAMWWTLLLASGGRGTLLGVVAGSMVAALLFRRSLLPWARVQGLGALAGGLAYAALFRGSEHGVAARLGAGSSGRMPLWELALDYARAHPWLGVGPMHYAYQSPLHTSAHPHSQLLQWAAEWGLPATFLFVAMVLWAAWTWMRQVQRASPASEPSVDVSLTVVWVGVGVLALVDGVLVMPLSQLFAAFVGGVTWARLAASPPHRGLRTVRRSRAWRSGAFALALVLAGTVLPTALHPQQRHEAYQRCANGRPDGSRLLHPRFWQAGYLGDWTRTCDP